MIPCFQRRCKYVRVHVPLHSCVSRTRPQGEQLRTVDEHIVTVAERVKEGQRELTAASRSSRAYRNKCLWLWLVAAVIVSVVLIILLS